MNPKIPDSAILKSAQDFLKLCYDTESNIYDHYTRNMAFIALKQWEYATERADVEITARRNAGKPMLVIDGLGTLCDQVINDWRRNKLGITVGPADGLANEDTAKIFSGKIKEIFYRSKGNVATDSAFAQMVRGNRGYWGLSVEYRPGSMKQDIWVRKFPNANAVFLDPLAKRIDKLDAQNGLIQEPYNRDKLQKEYPEVAFTDYTTGFNDCGVLWYPNEETVVLAEYYQNHPIKKTLQKVSQAIPVNRKGKKKITDEVYSDEWSPKTHPGLQLMKRSDGSAWQDERDVPDIWGYLLTGNEVLDRSQWVGDYIPIIPMEGKEIIADGQRHLHGAISRSLDAQVEVNFAESSIAWEFGTTQKAERSGAKGSFETMKERAQNPDYQDSEFFEWDIVYDQFNQRVPEPVKESHEPQIQAFILAGERARNLVRETAGFSKTSVGIEDGRVKSGRQADTLKTEADNGSYDFADSGSISLDNGGTQLVDLIPKVYGEPELMQILDEQDRQMAVLVNADPATHQLTPKGQDKAYMLADAEYAVRVSAAPSHATMREEKKDTAMQLYPEMTPEQKQQALGPILRMNDMEELADRIDPPKGEGEMPVPPAVQQKLQVQAQHLQILSGEMQKMIAEKEAKTAELSSKERIADEDRKAKQQMNAENNLTKVVVEEIRDSFGRLAENFEQLRHELDTRMGIAQMQHGVEQGEVEHERAQLTQGRDQQHATNLQESAQANSQQLQDSAQAAAAQQAAQAQQNQPVAE